MIQESIVRAQFSSIEYYNFKIWLGAPVQCILIEEYWALLSMNKE